jgi:hypothetical protein
MLSSLLKNPGYRLKAYLNQWLVVSGQRPVFCYNVCVAKKTDKMTIEKEKLRPRERAPILPTKKFEDKRKREKHKKDLRRANNEQ